MVKLLDWGVDPSTIPPADYSSLGMSADSSGSGSYDPYSSSSYSGGSYSSCGGVYQLGDYTNAPDMEIVPQQTQNREDVLNTLMGGSYTPDAVKKCEELITVEKKKGVKA